MLTRVESDIIKIFKTWSYLRAKGDNTTRVIPIEHLKERNIIEGGKYKGKDSVLGSNQFVNEIDNIAKSTF